MTEETESLSFTCYLSQIFDVDDSRLGAGFRDVLAAPRIASSPLI